MRASRVLFFFLFFLGGGMSLCVLFNKTYLYWKGLKKE